MFRLAFEFPAVGGVVPSQKLTTVKLLKYTNPEDYVLMASEFIFIIYILYYIVEESIEIKIHGLSYFFNIWNMLDICVIGVIIAWFLKFFLLQCFGSRFHLVKLHWMFTICWKLTCFWKNCWRNLSCMQIFPHWLMHLELWLFCLPLMF